VPLKCEHFSREERHYLEGEVLERRLMAGRKTPHPGLGWIVSQMEVLIFYEKSIKKTSFHWSQKGLGPLKGSDQNKSGLVREKESLASPDCRARQRRKGILREVVVDRRVRITRPYQRIGGATATRVEDTSPSVKPASRTASGRSKSAWGGRGADGGDELSNQTRSAPELDQEGAYQTALA